MPGNPEAMKVVSLLPSATEIVSCVGGQPFLQGRSHECNFPEGVCSLPILTGATNKFESSAQMHQAVQDTLSKGGGLYYVDEELLKKISPDVVVTQSVCVVCSVDFKMVEKIAQTMVPKPKLIDLNPQSLDEVIEDCVKVGEAIGLSESAQQAVELMRMRVAQAAGIAKERSKDTPRVEVIKSANVRTGEEYG